MRSMARCSPIFSPRFSPFANAFAMAFCLACLRISVRVSNNCLTPSIIMAIATTNAQLSYGEPVNSDAPVVCFRVYPPQKQRDRTD